MSARVGMAALSGLMLAAAFPKIGEWRLAFVALVPLLLALQGVSPRHAALLGLVAGIAFFSLLLEWIRIFDVTGWVALTLLHAGYVALFAWVVARLRRPDGGWRSLLLVAAAWTAVEWLRSVGPCALTWGGLAYALHDSLPLVQGVSLVGPFGLSFLVALVNAAAADLGAALLSRTRCGRLRRWDEGERRGTSPAGRTTGGPALRLAVVGALLLGAWGWGSWRLARPLPAAKTARVALLQGSLGREGVRGTVTIEDVKAGAQTYLDLTEDAAAAAPAMIVWPESAVTGRLVVDPRLAETRDRIAAAAAQHGADLVVGAAHKESEEDRRNSAFLFTPDGRLAGRQDKVHLVPFGEYTPFRRQLDFLYRHFPIIPHDFTPGEGSFPLPAQAAPLGVVICFESSFPRIARDLRRRGAQVLAILTNDAWFGTRSATWQHYHMATFRAVEGGCSVLRAATTGYSAILDPRGREIARGDLFRRQVLHGEARMEAVGTLYLKIGDVAAWGSILAVILALFLRRRQDSDTRGT